MATTSGNDHADGVEFTYEDDLVTARDIESGVAASGKSKPAALSRLADALTLYTGGGEPIDDEEAFLKDIGVDPDTVEDAGEPPWVK
ncbi:type II toxin-antitoxin system HicB family antitoxin [Haloparvum sp. PAK95]|uniref:type II toxin-antitoxin system HicB family antitoxin n=1 Tax=Haloparvum sp. PAK95 TaxID=3418962 RepID=UPI003D2EE4E1